MLRFICRILRTGINVQNNRNSDIIKCTLHKSYILLAVDQGKHIKVSIFGYKIIRIMFILLNYSQAWSWLFRKLKKKRFTERLLNNNAYLSTIHTHL